MCFWSLTRQNMRRGKVEIVGIVAGIAAQADDQRVHQQAVAATYAGDADPYRHDEDDEQGNTEELLG